MRKPYGSKFNVPSSAATRLGNLLAAADAYPFRRYRLAGSAFGPHLKQMMKGLVLEDVMNWQPFELLPGESARHCAWERPPRGWLNRGTAMTLPLSSRTLLCRALRIGQPGMKQLGTSQGQILGAFSRTVSGRIGG